MTYHIPLLIVTVVMARMAFVMIWGQTKTVDFDKIKQKRLTKKTSATKRREIRRKMQQKTVFNNERKQHKK